MANMEVRTKMVKAMEFLIRSLNAEDLMEDWLMVGVPDGDIEYGDLDVDEEAVAEDICNVSEDEEFAALMGTFLATMSLAYTDGGLYCDGVVSK